VDRTSEAVKILEAAPADPDGRVHYLLGRTYQQQGKSDKARNAMDEFRKRRKTINP
jgi:Flp pilus assembly protein TadD